MSAQNNRKEMEKELKEFLANKEIVEMGMKEISIMFFARYLELQKAGFTEDQAFKIILARGVS